MRSVLVLLAMIAALIAGSWIGGETLLARSARQTIADDPRLSAAGVDELREAQRVGVRINAPRLDDPAQGVALAGDFVDLWVSPTAPNALRATVAPGMALRADGREVVLGAGGASGEMRFSPTHGFAMNRAGLRAEGASLGGAALVGPMRLGAQLTGYGADSPPGTGAAYDIDASVAGLSLAPLTGGRVPDIASLSGGGRVWLSGVPLTAGAVAEGRIEGRAVQLIGVRADAVKVTLGPLAARVHARLLADAAGLAAGEVVIDTADSDGFVARAADLGLIPPAAAPLARAALASLAAGAGAEAKAETGAAAGAEASAASSNRLIAASALPTPHPGETRITLSLRDGRVWLGPLAVGAAPRLSMLPRD